jgi:hypothetical protein
VAVDIDHSLPQCGRSSAECRVAKGLS